MRGAKLSSFATDGHRPPLSTRTVDNFIAALRTKLGEDPATPRHLVTARGAGYRLELAH